MRGLANLAVVIDGSSCVDNRQVAYRGVRIDYGASHYCNPTPQTNGGGDDSLRADGVDEFKPERRYLRGDFATQRIIAEGDKAVPNPSRVEIWQNAVTT